jgi:hypothetical protein
MSTYAAHCRSVHRARQMPTSADEPELYRLVNKRMIAEE